MSSISKPYTFSANTTISSSEVNANFDTLYNDYNGGISATNLASGAVTTAKIADSNVTTGKLADDAVTAAKLADASVFPANLTSGLSGSSWAWQDWTPSYTNLSIGNGTVVAKYSQIGKTIVGEYSLTVGSTTSFSSEVAISVPVTAARISRNIGPANILDAGTANKPGVATLSTTGLFKVYVVAGTADTRMNLVSNTTPQTWATGDILCFSFTYEAA